VNPVPSGLPSTIRSARARDLHTAAAAALAGGRAAMRLYGSAGLEIRDKAAGAPVTEADHAANAAILAVLDERSPADPVLSEESPPPAASVPGPSGSGDGRTWIVDPLDGTKEFIAGNGEFAVMVGLALDGAAAVGAVYRPDPGILFLGGVGDGAWKADVPPAGGAPPTAFRPLRTGRAGRGPLRFVRSRSHPDPLLSAVEAELGDAEIVLCGSVGVKCSLIAAGRADAYVHPVAFLKEWDTCAPEAVLVGAGGRVTDCGGEPLRYGKLDPRQRRGILAAREPAWSSILPLVRRVAAPILGRES
jgi:3'(2'), 5'-bisphosphate nucleotidase